MQLIFNGGPEGLPHGMDRLGLEDDLARQPVEPVAESPLDYRAKQDVVYVIRGDDPTQTEIKLSVEEKVQPGDIIRVAERLF